MAQWRVNRYKEVTGWQSRREETAFAAVRVRPRPQTSPVCRRSCYRSASTAGKSKAIRRREAWARHRSRRCFRCHDNPPFPNGRPSFFDLLTLLQKEWPKVPQIPWGSKSHDNNSDSPWHLKTGPVQQLRMSKVRGEVVDPPSLQLIQFH